MHTNGHINGGPRRRAFTRLVAVGVITMTASACQTLIPGHENSYDNAGESVTVRMLTWGDLDERQKASGENWQDDWGAVFGTKSERSFSAQRDGLESHGELGTAALISAAAGLALDYVHTELEDEATRYEAQFAGRAVRDDFWDVTRVYDERGDLDDVHYTQRYYGIEIVRTTTANDGDSPSFRMIVGLGPSQDQSMFLAAPLSFVCRSSKAKVLETNAWSLLPPLWWHHLLESGDTVSTEIEIEIEASWVRKDEALHRQVALIPIRIPQYSLTTTPVWRAKGEGSKKGKLPTDPTGWFGGVPISSFVPLGQSQAAGTFKVFARVTQRDPSNARKYLEKGAELLQESRPKIIGALGGSGGSGGASPTPVALEHVEADRFDEDLFSASAMNVLRIATDDALPSLDPGAPGTGEEALRVRAYLTRYGYLDEQTAGTGASEFLSAGEFERVLVEKAEQRDESLRLGVWAFQSFHGLEPTGELDRETIDLMRQPRCGRPDMGEFVVDGRKWTRTELTYSIGSWADGLTEDEVATAIAEATRAWEKVTPLRLSRTSGDADLIIEFAAGLHSDGPLAAFDGAGSTLAHAYYPPPNFGPLAGDVHFDDAEAWSVADAPALGGTDLVSVAVHELGHSLGLAHSPKKGAVMYAIYKGVRRALHADDVKGIQRLYGTP